MVTGGQHHAPTALIQGESPATDCTGRWVDPRAGQDRCRGEKISYPSKVSNPGQSST